MDLRTEQIRYIDLHHTAGHEPNTEAIRRYHMDVKDYGDIGYNSVIEMDGTIGKGRDTKWAGAHDPGIPEGETRSMNQISYAISSIGNFEEDEMPEVQFQSLLNESERVCKLYNIPTTRIRRHRDQSPTACPGKNFPYERLLSELRKRLNQGRDRIPAVTPAGHTFPNVAPKGFTFPNNAKVVGDDLYIRDENGKRIEGRYVANGDEITVLDVSYSKQLAYVEYPTPSGVRSGWVKNLPSLIHYFFPNEWSNGSTLEPVVDLGGLQFGYLNPYEKATPLYRQNGKLHVVYGTDKGVHTKSGFVKYDGNFNKF